MSWEKYDRKRWSDYYSHKEFLYKLIEEKTKLLIKNEDGKYKRCVRYTEDKEALEELDYYIKQLDIKYKEALGGNGRHIDLPIILNDVENININVFEAFRSIKVTKEDEDKCLTIGKMVDLAAIWKDKFLENFNKYGLESNKIEYGIGYDKLLELAKANSIQVRQHTGLQYVALVRKVNERRSKKYKYGCIILDREANINFSNKEAIRSNRRVENLYKKFELEIPHDPSLEFYIKD